MNLNNLKKLYKNCNFIFAVTCLLILVSAGLIYLNKGFYFSEFNKRVVVEVKGSDQKQVETVLDLLKDIGEVSKLDRKNNVIEFEYENYEEIKTASLEKLEKQSGIGDEIALEVINVNQSDLAASIQSYGAIIVLTFLASIFVSYFIRYRKNGNLKLKGLLIPYASYLSILVLSLLIQTGFISLISRIYQVKELDLISIYLTSLFISILVLLGSQINVEEQENYKAINRKIWNKQSLLVKDSIRFSILVLGFANLGLGINFLMPALMIVSGFIITALASAAVLKFDLKKPDFKTKKSVKLVAKKNTVKKKSSTKVSYTGKKVRKKPRK